MQQQVTLHYVLNSAKYVRHPEGYPAVYRGAFRVRDAQGKRINTIWVEFTGATRQAAEWHIRDGYPGKIT